MEATILDFDAHYAKIKGEEKQIRVRGEDYVLPPDIPVAVMFLLQSGESMNDAYFVLLATLFGEDKVLSWMKGDENEVMSTSEFQALVKNIMQLYYPQTEGDDPKAVAAEEKTG